MKTAVKPAKGCLANGFTWVSPDGGLTQLSWTALKERGEALYLHDGIRWRRMRDVRDLKKYGEQVRVAVAPIVADAAGIEASGILLPADLLTGDWADKVHRLRELAELPPGVVRASNAWASLDEASQRALDELWYPGDTSVTDAQIVGILHAKPGTNPIRPEFHDEQLQAVRRLQGDLSVLGFRTNLSRRDAENVLMATDLLPEGLSPVEFAHYLHVRGAFVREYQSSTFFQEEAAFLARFSGSEDPLRDALNALYGLDAATRDEALAATAVLTSCAVTSSTAVGIVREIGLSGASPEKLALVASALARSGGADASTVAKTVVELFDRDPEACLQRYGTVEMLVGRMFPDRSVREHRQIASQLRLGGARPIDEQARTALAAVDRKVLDEVRMLMREEVSAGPESFESQQLALRAVVAFGEHAPDWLRTVATSARLEEARTLARLPDVDTANRRIEQLTRSLAAPRPTMAELEKAARLAGFYRGLVAAPDGAGVGAVMALLSDEDLVDVLPNATAANKKTAEIAKMLSSSGLTPSERTTLESTAAWLTQYSRALKRAVGSDGSDGPPSADPDVAALLVAARNDTNLLGLLAPNPKIAAKQADACARSAASGDAWESAVESERRLWGSAALQDDRDQGMIIPEDVEARRAAQEAELDLWKRYSLAFLEGDRATLLEIGGTLRPEKTDGRTRVSVHDALFWLPGNLTDSTAPDGTRFGDWLLDESRGAGAMQGANGRMSLQLAAESWSLLGGKGAKLNDVVRARVSMDYGGHDDPTSMFFAAAKVTAESAQVSATHLHYSRDMPTLLPVGRVFSAASEETATGDAVDGAAPAGFRGYFLTRDDPRGVQLGMLTDCCQHPANAGRDCAIAGQSHPASGFFVVEDLEGNVVAQSWVWATAAPAADGATSTGVIFDNIEARLGGSGGRARAVRAIYEQAADELSTRFDRVLVGAGGNDVDVHDLPLTSATMRQADIGYHGYGGDSASQRVWREGRVRPGVRVEARANGFTVTEDGSSFSFTAASVPAEMRRIDEELAVMRQDAPARPALEERLAVLRALSASGSSWGAGLFTEDGPDRHVVEVRGPAGRDLAIRELSSRASGNYLFRDETGREEVVEIRSASENPAPRVEYSTLPTDYADKSKLGAVLVSVGVPEAEAEQLLTAFSGNIRAAHTAWRNGWPTAVAASALVQNCTQPFWIGGQPCPAEIQQMADPAERVRAAHLYAMLANSSPESHAATSALASPEALAKAEFAAALATVAKLNARGEKEVPGDMRWRRLSTSLRENAAMVPSDPEIKRLEAEGTRLLGLEKPSPWSGDGIDDTLAAAVRLAAEEVFKTRNELLDTGRTVDPRGAAEPYASALPPIVFDPATSARARVPVELILNVDRPVSRHPENAAIGLALADELAAKGLTPGEASLLLSAGINTGTTNLYAAASPEIVEHVTTLRGDPYGQERIHEVLSTSNNYRFSGSDVVRLAKTSKAETSKAMALDRSSPSRALLFREVVGADVIRPDETYEEHQARQERIEGDLVTYRKATKHVNVPQDFSPEDVFEMGKIVDRARETCATAGVMMTYGENMPDYYFEPETLRAIGSYTSGKDALASRISPYASIYSEDVAMTAPILDRFVELTPSLASGPESARPTLLDIARARRSGCSVEEIAEIVQIAPAASSVDQESAGSVHAVRDALLISRTLRQARRDGVPKETLEAIAPLVVEKPYSTKKTNPLNSGDEKEVRWLLDLVASHPGALERLSRYVGEVSMQENEGVDQMLHELAAEFGGVPEKLGGLLPAPARSEIRSFF